LEHDTFLRYAKEPGLFRLEAERRIAAGARVVFVDEVQKIPALLDECHALIERHKVRVILTGSSARKLRRGASNLLAGRAVLRHLQPLTRAELGASFELERALHFGTLPSAWTLPDADVVDLLRSYVETYVREEILAESLVRNLGGFARFLDIAAAQNGAPTNFTAVARDCGVAARTVQEYFQLLEDTLLGFRVEPYRKSPRARMVSHPRFYFFDTGVTNALQRRLTAPPDPVSRGRLFEQWVIGESRRVLDYAKSEARLFYYRTHNGAEVDLLIEKHGKLRLAIEIKSARRVVCADLTGLRSFADAHPNVPRVVVTTAPRGHALDLCQALSVDEYLERLEEVA
jgi:predicted AAA+ superfamily ATPase